MVDYYDAHCPWCRKRIDGEDIAEKFDELHLDDENQVSFDCPYCGKPLRAETSVKVDFDLEKVKEG